MGFPNFDNTDSGMGGTAPDAPPIDYGFDTSYFDQAQGGSDPTNNVGANADNSRAPDPGSFADAQYGSDYQTPAQRSTDNSSWDVTNSVGSNKKQQQETDYSGMDSTQDQSPAFSDISQPDVTATVGANAAQSQDQRTPPEYANRGEINVPNTGETPDESTRITNAYQPIFDAQDAGDQQADYSGMVKNLDDVTSQVGAAVQGRQQQAQENLETRFGPGSDYSLTGTSQMNADYQQQATRDALVNLDATAQPSLDEMAQMSGSFTTPSGQDVTRTFDGAGYSSWSIPGADDRANVLYNDNGNWRAISRDQAAQYQQQGATPDQFTSTTNAASIAGQAMQSTGTQPDWTRTLEAAGMIAAAPFVASLGGAGLAPASAEGLAGAGSLAETIGTIGGVKPLTLGAAYLLKGTGEDLGTTGLIGQGLDLASNLPGIGQYAQQAKSIPIPEFAQNPLAQIEQVAQHVGQQAAGGNLLAATPIGIAVTAFNNAVANAPNKDPMGVAKGFFTEDPIKYAEQSGLQRAGVEYLLTSTVQLHDPRSGLSNALSISDPVGKFHTVFQDELAKNPDPQAAAAAAFDRTNNAVAEFLHTYDLLNPLWFAVETPGLEKVIGEFFGNAGSVAAKVIPGAQQAGDFFLHLSSKSGADIATDNLSRTLGTMVGHPAGVPDAVADLYDIGKVFRAQGGDAGKALARDYVTSYGGTVDGALSMGNRLVAGAEQRIAAKGTVYDLDAYLASITSDLRGRNFAFDQLKGAQDSYRLYRQTDAPLIEAQAALQSATTDIRNALYKQAGVDLKAINDPAIWQQAIQFGADSLRTLFLLPGAPALALKKIVDEAVRSGTQGVFGVRPADLQLVRTGARFLEGRDSSLLSNIGRRVEDASTVRSYLAQGVPVGPEMARNLTASDRAAFSPFRITDKVLDSLVSSPTQHVRLNAAFQELKDFPQVREEMARNFADNIARTFDPRVVDPGDIALQSQRAYEMARTATNAADYQELARFFQEQGADFTPRVPASGMAKGTPVLPARMTMETAPAKVAENIRATGGQEQGLVKDATTTRTRGPQTYEQYQAKGGTPAALDQRPAFRDLGTSAGAGAGQPIPKAGDIDIAAGGGGMGYRTPYFRNQQETRLFGETGALDAGFGGSRGGVQGYGESKGAPRTSRQGALDRAAADQRATIVDELKTSGTLDSHLATIDPNDLAAIKINQVAANTEIKYAEKELAAGKHAGNEAAVYHDLAEMDRFANTLADMRATIDPSYTSDRLTRDSFGTAPDVTAQVGQARSVPLALPAGKLPPERLLLNQGERFPNFSQGPMGTVPGRFLGQPIDSRAVAAGYNRAGMVSQTAGGEFAAAQARQSIAGTERGNRIIGNFMERTPFGELASQGTVNGQQVFAPLLPFAAFHVHTTQFWARYFMEHPAVPFAIARTLNGVGFDEYGGVNTGNKYVSGLLELSTAAKLMHWAQTMYQYAQDVRANPNGNNPLQQAAKIAGQAIFGNEAFVRPFDYLSAPAQGVLQSTTNPMLDKKGNVDKREQMAEQGSSSPFTGAAQLLNGRFGTPIPRNIVAGVTNPAQPITNAIRSVAVNAVDQVGGNANIKGYKAESGIPYMAQNFGGARGWDTARTNAAVTDALTKQPQTPDGKALLAEYNHQQDVAGVGKFLPVRATEESGAPLYGTPKPFDKNATPSYSPGGAVGRPDFYVNRAEFPETKGFGIQQAATAKEMLHSTDPAIKGAAEAYYNENADKAFNYQRNAGTGGRDLGVGQPAGSYVADKATGELNGYNVKPMDQAQAQTAYRDLLASSPVNPGSVPGMDYNRQFLGNADVAAKLPASEQSTLGNVIAGNAKRTGAGLPQDQRTAQIAKEGELQQQVGTNPDGTPFTLGDLFQQSGLYSTKGADNAAIKAELSKNPIAAAYLAKEDAAYRASLVNTTTGDPKKDGLNIGIDGGFTVGDFLRQPGNLFEIDKRYADAKARGAPSSELNAILKEKDAVLASDLSTHPQVRAYFDATGQTKYAENPTSASAASRTGSNSSSQRSSSARTSARTSSYPTSRTTSTRGGSSNTRASSASGGQNQQAGNDFYNFYGTLSDRAEKAAVLDALDKAGVSPLGQKGVTPGQYQRALEVAKDALYTKRAGDILNTAGRPNGQRPQGLTRAQAEYAIGQLDQRYGIGGTPARANSAPALAPTPVKSTKTTSKFPYPGTTTKKPAAA